MPTFDFKITASSQALCETKASTLYGTLTANQKTALASNPDKYSNPQGAYGYEAAAAYDVISELWYILWVLTHPPIGPPTYEEWLEENE